MEYHKLDKKRERRDVKGWPRMASRLFPVTLLRSALQGSVGVGNLFSLKHCCLIILLCSCFTLPLFAQMWNGQDTLYGNEWIDYDQTYYKIPVAKDGIYRITGEQLQNNGIPINTIAADRFQLFHLGEEVPIYTSNIGEHLSATDYLEFYGQKNRSELDSFLFADPEADLLNPYYSLFTDTAAYFLTWRQEVGPTKRYTTIENDLSGDLPEPEGWFMHESRVVFAGHFLKQYYPIGGASIYYSHFDTGEGFGSRSILNFQQGGNTTQNVALNLPGLVPEGPSSQFKARFACGPNNHQQRITLELQEPYTEARDFNGFQVIELDIPVNTIQLPTNEELPVRFQGQADNKDVQSLAYVSIRYPRAFDFNGASSFAFSIPAANERTYLEIEGFDIGSLPPVLYDLTHQLRIETNVETGVVHVALPPSTEERRLVLVNPSSGVNLVSALTSVDFIDYQDFNRSFVIISHPALYDDGNGQNWVQAYADYRSSPEGGGYETIVVDIQQLYDQFGYGVNRHVVSLRNFAHFVKKNWSEVQYFFVVGKGREYIDIRSSSNYQEALGTSFFIPSFGYPASDNLMLASNDIAVPVVPVGRIAAVTPEEVRIYLEKVQALEQNINDPQTLEDRMWMKRIIHLGGGSGASEQQIIKNYLTSMGNVLETNMFGANVYSFYKATTDPIQTTVSDQIFKNINDGSSIITFFGHSSPGAFDFNIDNPENYENIGKYPLLFSLGCFSGNIFISNRSIGERFCFYENRGAVAYGASRGIGFVSALAVFAQQYYDYLGSQYYGAGIGDVLKATIGHFDFNSGISMETLVEQFTLHGDPAIRLHPRPGPDYLVDPGTVEFQPDIVNAQMDSFDLSFEVVNIGKNLPDSLEILVKQQLPEGTIREVRRQIVGTPSFRRSYTLRLPNFGKEAVGLNTFFIELDAENEIEELPAPAAEMNNELIRNTGVKGIELFIIDNSARPVYPPEFALVGRQGVTLKASTTDALAPERTYLLEIDTTHYFDSALKRQIEIVQIGGVIKWTPDMIYQDSTVYYWRISPDSTDTGLGYTWEMSSFTFIEDSPEGWGQGHFGQFVDNELDDLELFEGASVFRFVNSTFNIRIKNKVWDPNDRPEYVVNGTPYASPWPWLLDGGIQIIINDSITGAWMYNPPGGSYGTTNGNSNSNVWAFDTNIPEIRDSLMLFIRDFIPEGKYVMLYSVQRTNQSVFGATDWAEDEASMGRTIFDVLEAEGATLVRELELRGSVPYVFMFQKGAGPLDEAVGETISSTVYAECNPTYRWYEGSATSPVIGPSVSWEKASFYNNPSNNAEFDSLRIQILGLKDLEFDPILINDLEVDLAEPYLEQDLGNIDAETYPYLQLRFYAYDAQERTAPEIGKWYVYKEGVAELAVNPADLFNFQSDTLQQGATLKLETMVDNIGETNVTDVKVRFGIRDTDNEEAHFEEKTISLNAGDELPVEFQVSTANLPSGKHTIFLEVNEEKRPKEYSYLNNRLVEGFTVQKDFRQPVLDVTFDGTHIFDGDLVSAAPEIFIQLKDENPYLPLIDSSLFVIKLKQPDGTIKTIRSSDEEVIFQPAESTSENKAQLIWHPRFEEDGIYKLSVQGMDASGNNSGELAYRVNFKVITQSTVGNVLNYPNPFSTSTQFVYTLTGSTAPKEFTIRILTVSGRIVKEIRLHEEELLKIGTHRTDYAWNGTDDFGDKLANGIYLYQVIVKDEDGKEYGHQKSEVDQFFRKRMGKLVILR